MESGSLKYIAEPPHEELLAPPRRRFPFNLSRKNRILSAAAILIILALIYARFLAAPRSMQADTIVSVPRGQGLSATADELALSGAIRSEFAFKALTVLFGGQRGVEAGDYYFARPEGALRVAWRLTHSLYDLTNIRVTIPEGFDSKQIAGVIGTDHRFTRFDTNEFLSLAAPYEGYLFPDTYLFLPNITAQAVVDAMLANYKRRIQTLEADVRTFGRPITDVITMASIVEEEARTAETRQTIAGILWKRLDQGIPLQVDASVVYATGKKDGTKLAPDDFKVESPYNTYLHKGLPPSPITNPGLDSIRAVLHPIPTKYYFYLSDKDGAMHYAVTLDEHEANRAKYLGY